MKVGVITFISDNYGALLQSYSMQIILKRLGFTSEIINRPWGNFCRKRKIKDRIKSWYEPNVFSEFRKTFLPLSNIIKDEEGLKNISSRYDAIIVGSDQVWNCDCIDEMGYFYYLDWVPDDVGKYSYAVSFGKDTFNTSDKDRCRVKELIARFNKISVRESSGVRICKNSFDIDADNLIDPTLLLSKEDYVRIINKKKNNKSYVCQFFLDCNEFKTRLSAIIATKFGCNIIDNYPEPLSKIDYILRKKRFPTVAVWLSNIENADYVITDSFHGMVFSIIFHKKFVVINNKQRGSARFESLLTKLSLMDRLIDDTIEPQRVLSLLEIPIDYDMIDKIIDIERNKSLNFLKSIQ